MSDQEKETQHPGHDITGTTETQNKPAEACPNCKGTSISISGGMRLCGECGYEFGRAE